MAGRDQIAFSTSPFSLLADESSAACWAGRSQTLAQLRRLCGAWANRRDSTLDVVWANLGAGKTHALFHLRHLLGEAFKSEPPSIVTFVDIPENIRDFHELYKSIAATVPFREMAEMALRDSQSHLSARLSRAFRALVHGSEGEQRLVQDWICGGRPGLRELRAVTGIDGRIETDGDAETVLSELIHLSAVNGQRFIILFDEFQRVAHLGVRRKDALLAHLRTVFSRNPANLSMVLAIGSRVEQTAIDLLPPELRSIIGMRPSISLPEMNMDEAREFIVQRFAWYRPEGYSGTAEEPFTAEQIDFVLSYLVNEAKTSLIPRTILQILGIIFDQFFVEGEVRCGNDELGQMLKSLRWDES